MRSDELPYDSRPDTLLHSLLVGQLMIQLINEMLHRSVRHDLSKTQSPEVETFDKYTKKLATTEYGSEEYVANLMAMSEAMKHHYAENRHHPEHFANGINDMTLVDLVEMLADWKAATTRTKNGDLSKSLKIQKERFGISDQLLKILENTAKEFGWI